METCRLRPQEHGTDRPLQNHVRRMPLSAGFWGGQLFVTTCFSVNLRFRRGEI